MSQAADGPQHPSHEVDQEERERDDRHQTARGQHGVLEGQLARGLGQGVGDPGFGQLRDRLVRAPQRLEEVVAENRLAGVHQGPPGLVDRRLPSLRPGLPLGLEPESGVDLGPKAFGPGLGPKLIANRGSLLAAEPVGVEVERIGRVRVAADARLLVDHAEHEREVVDLELARLRRALVVEGHPGVVGDREGHVAADGHDAERDHDRGAGLKAQGDAPPPDRV